MASEVKNLANQSARATEEITTQIQGVQSETGGAVEAIGGISTIIHHISGMSNAVASTIEEQSAAINEITRNISEAAEGTQGVAGNMADVTRAARSTGDTVASLNSITGELRDESQALQKQVTRFLGDVRKAEQGTAMSAE